MKGVGCGDQQKNIEDYCRTEKIEKNKAFPIQYDVGQGMKEKPVFFENIIFLETTPDPLILHRPGKAFVQITKGSSWSRPATDQVNVP